MLWWDQLWARGKFSAILQQKGVLGAGSVEYNYVVNKFIGIFKAMK